MYILKEKNSGKYYVNPSCWGYRLSNNILDATVFDTYEVAKEVKEDVDLATVIAYRAWSGAVPEAEVEKLEIEE